MGAKNNDSLSEKQAIVKIYTPKYRKCGNSNLKNDSRPCMGASAFLKSVDFRAFEINVKTIAPTQKLYQSGHAIWWGRSPKIIHTFLETYDLSGKTIAAFCTSGSSPHEDASIRGYEPDAVWLKGRRFLGTSQVEDWVNSLDLPGAAEAEADKMYIQIRNTVWTAVLEDNPSVTAWKELLAKGPLTVDMSDYGGFEKVGSIGANLTQSNRQITARPGDIILYQGSSVTIYYDENTCNFTLLGHIDGATEDELREVLKAGGGNVSVTFSLKSPEAAE